MEETDSIIRESRDYPRMQTSRAEEGPVSVIYQNPMQMSVAGRWRSRRTMVEGGRGTGKSSLLSDHVKFCYYTIPRGTDVLLGSSYRQTLGITMPTMIKELEQKHHLIEGRDFTRGRANPRLGFEMPLYQPRTWNNVIHWRNGMVTLLLSTAVKSCANGLNITSLRTDEAKFINWSFYCDSVKPAIRGAVYDHPGWRKDRNEFYCSEWAVSDKGVTVEQTRFAQGMRELQTPDVNDRLAEMLAQYEVAERQGWSDELLHTPRYLRQLHELRCQSTAYFNFSTIENIAVLGGGADPEQYIRELRRSMAPMLFDIVIMGRDVTQKTIDSYYKNFDENVHCYTSNQAEEESILNGRFNRRYHIRNEAGTQVEWEAPDLDEIHSVSGTCMLDADVDPDLPFLLGYDFNHGVNTLCIAQNYRFQGQDSLMLLKTMYNTDESRLEGLCEEFCRYYVYKKQKSAVVFMDSQGKQGGAYASQYGDDLRYYNIIRRKLALHGWDVTIVDLGAGMAHDLKYEFVNDCFAGKKGIMPRINLEKNDLLIASMQNSRMIYGDGGRPRKDKRLEKKKASTEDEKLRIAATDITDALDQILIGVVRSGGEYTHRYSRFGVAGVSVSLPRY